MTCSDGGEWLITGVIRFFAGLVGLGILAFVIGYCGAGGVLAALGR